MSANSTTSTLASAFALAGPATTTTPPSESHSRRNDLHMRIHQAHVRANIRRLQALGRGLPSTVRHTQRTRTTHAAAHTVPPATTIATTTTTTTIITTTNLTVRAPQPRRPLTAIILNGLPTPPEPPSPAPVHAPVPAPAPAQPQNQTQTQTETGARPRLPTRRSRTRAARTGFHGTGAGLSFGLDVFGDDPVLSPRAAVDGGDVRRTPGAPARIFAGYFPQMRAASSEREGGEKVFHAI